jgi:hypothetical protein
MVHGLLAAAEIHRDLMNLIVVQNYESFVGQPRGVAQLSRWVTDLNPHAHAL